MTSQKFKSEITREPFSSYGILQSYIWKLGTIFVYWASRKTGSRKTGSRKTFVTLLSLDSHVTKISKSDSERTIAVRAYCSHTFGFYESLALWPFTGIVETIIWRHYHVIVTWPNHQCNVQIACQRGYSVPRARYNYHLPSPVTELCSTKRPLGFVTDIQSEKVITPLDESPDHVFYGRFFS